ncbi:MAG: hypothetical protein MUO63_11225 [Desulfobulbaceae bacterium]|nr:hypothetical protein [Desulfobulbaceae bacterium]
MMTLTAHAAVMQMRQLHSFLMWLPGQKKPERMLEEPDEVQAQIINAFGWEIKNGVLQEFQP